jgi:hypothetical protein
MGIQVDMYVSSCAVEALSKSIQRDAKMDSLMAWLRRICLIGAVTFCALRAHCQDTNSGVETSRHDSVAAAREGGPGMVTVEDNSKDGRPTDGSTLAGDVEPPKTDTTNGAAHDSTRVAPRLVGGSNTQVVIARLVLTVAPTVSSGTFTVHNMLPTWAHVQVSNLQGQVVTVICSNGASSLELDLSGLPAGTYYVSVPGTYTKACKIVKN